MRKLGLSFLLFTVCFSARADDTESKPVNPYDKECDKTYAEMSEGAVLYCSNYLANSYQESIDGITTQILRTLSDIQGTERVKQFSDAQNTWVYLREQTCELVSLGVAEPDIVKAMCFAEYNEARYKELSYYFDSIKEGP